MKLAMLDQFSFHHVLEETPGTALVLFTTPYCGSCKAMKQALLQLEADSGLHLFEVDAGTDQALVESFEVFHLPALFLFQDGAYHAPLEVEPVVSRILGKIDELLKQPAREAP